VAVLQTDRGLVATMPAVPSRAWPAFGIGVGLMLGSVGMGVLALPSIAAQPSLAVTGYTMLTACVLLLSALAWYAFDEGRAHLRAIEVVVDPRTQTLIVPRYRAVSFLPSGQLSIPLSDVVRVRTFEIGLKGVMRGKVCVDRDTEEAYLFPSHAVAPFAVLHTFATEIADAVDRARGDTVNLG
jgi:hypothetical protein